MIAVGRIKLLSLPLAPRGPQKFRWDRHSPGGEVLPVVSEHHAAVRLSMRSRHALCIAPPPLKSDRASLSHIVFIKSHYIYAQHSHNSRIPTTEILLSVFISHQVIIRLAPRDPQQFRGDWDPPRRECESESVRVWV